MNNKSVTRHQRSDGDNNNRVNSMDTRPAGSEVSNNKTEPHNLKNFDDFRTKGLSSEHSNEEEKSNNENENKDDNNNIRRYIANDIKGKKLQLKKGTRQSNHKMQCGTKQPKLQVFKCKL